MPQPGHLFYIAMIKGITGILLLLILAGSSWAQGKVGVFLAPTEIVGGEEFVVTASASALQRGINRVVVIEYPENIKLLHAYAIDEDGADTMSLDQNVSVSSFFSKEKNRHIASFTDNSGIFSANYGAEIYSFTFESPKTATISTIKICLVERGDPSGTPEPPAKKGAKPKKKRVPLLSSEWRVVAPDIGEKFSFSEIGGKPYSAIVRIVSGWDNGSRALFLDGNSHAMLHTDSAMLRDLFAGPFTISAWVRTSDPKQPVFSWHNFVKDSLITLITNAAGQIELHGLGAVIVNPAIVGDGAWHNILISKDEINRYIIAVDGEASEPTTLGVDLDLIDRFEIGDSTRNASLTVDELVLAYGASSVYKPLPVAQRNTTAGLFALFHFEDFGHIARSSFFPRRRNVPDSLSRGIPVYIELDTNASFDQSSSPVLAERAILTVEQSSATKVTFTWQATSELGVKRYELQRRIASFGDYEKTLEIKAKQPLPVNSDDHSIIARANYSAVETLPTLSRDIELYYRLAIIGPNDSVLAYTEPVKLEYGGARDVFVDQNKPNPFNPKTTISLRMIRTAPVSIKIYDIMGLEMMTLFDGKLTAGKHSVDVDATQWPAGIYYYKVKTAHTIVTKKMVLAK
jgi:hypothetical protein